MKWWLWPGTKAVPGLRAGHSVKRCWADYQACEGDTMGLWCIWDVWLVISISVGPNAKRDRVTDTFKWDIQGICPVFEKAQTGKWTVKRRCGARLGRVHGKEAKHTVPDLVCLQPKGSKYVSLLFPYFEVSSLKWCKFKTDYNHIKMHNGWTVFCVR